VIEKTKTEKTQTKTNFDDLQQLVGKAVGPSDQIDQEIDCTFGDDRDGKKLTPYTASVDECITLISRVLPDWHWHVGHGPMGGGALCINDRE
jgi:hypothetical protein